jgi:hypothetical protein
VTGACGAEATLSATEVLFDRLTGQLGHGDTESLSLVTESGVEVI